MSRCRRRPAACNARWETSTPSTRSAFVSRKMRSTSLPAPQPRSTTERAPLVFVGEGPGADEDAQGRPFVGRAGQLLTKIIEAIGLKREDVIIGNVNRCRPPGNRAPTTEEAAMCKPFLLREIAAAKKASFMWEQVGRVVEAITLRSADDAEFTEALTDNYLKMKIPGRLESNRWIEARVEQAGVDVLEGRVA